MIDLAALLQNVKNTLRDKGKNKIEEIKMDFKPDRFTEEKVTNYVRKYRKMSVNCFVPVLRI